MQLPELGKGLAIGVGKANFREAYCDAGGIIGRMSRVETPTTREGFFGRTASMLLHAAHDQEAEWGVLGIPGPVSVDVDRLDNVTQKFRITNIEALNVKAGLDPVAEMVKADPAIKDLIFDSNF